MANRLSEMDANNETSGVSLSQDEIRQYGALCYRRAHDGPEVLLITTRVTRRWMIPKGWPISGLKPREVAEREAWEEAGVVGTAEKTAFGDFVYDKVLRNGQEIRPVVEVFLLKVRRRRKQFPEMDQRAVVWLSPADAVQRVDEPALGALLLNFERVARRETPASKQPTKPL